MKSTGIVRKIDDLGRVVIPKETRKVLDLNDGDPVEFYVEGEMIILKKLQRECIFCGNDNQEEIRKLFKKLICVNCIKALRKTNIEVR